jgi:threonyl-tRNA synthetase
MKIGKEGRIGGTRQGGMNWTRGRRLLGPRVLRRMCHGEKQAVITKSNVEIAQQQQLYMIDKSTPGSIFFLPYGTRLFDKLVEFMKVQQRMFGFEHVVTPLIYKRELWQTSGHWQHYKRDMFEVLGAHHGAEEDGAAEEFGLKPMNCPGHCVMFGQYERSFRELPVRYADFSPLHRNEASGALTGLTRVRKFHQDDGHIFCEPGQIQGEIEGCLRLIDSVYGVFGLRDYQLTLSTRPAEFAGAAATWDEAERGLREALDKSGRPWTVNVGDGAFYGPKIDILVTDNNGKEHQTATIQLDFQLPQNFALRYATENSAAGETRAPVLIHRAVYGSIERFMSLLIDHYQGKWPFWLNPRQAVVIPVASRHHEHAERVLAELSGRKAPTDCSPGKLDTEFYNVEMMSQEDTVGNRIRLALNQGFSYILMVGDREIENNTVAVRSRDSRKTENMPLDEVKARFAHLQNSYL